MARRVDGFLIGKAARTKFRRTVLADDRRTYASDRYVSRARAHVIVKRRRP
jgi:hypothetical protein